MAGSSVASGVADPPGKIDFAHDIVPIIRSRCCECHTNGTYKGSFSMDTRESMTRTQAIVVGRAAASELIERITSEEAEFRMPPKGDRLSPKQVELMKRWIDEGLAWESGFSFRASDYVAPIKPRRPELPPAGSEGEHPIDRMVRAYYAAHDITAPAELDDVAFLRRVYLDLVGLLPPPDRCDEFLRDHAADKRARLVGRLLDEHQAYAEHWLTFWNDLLRNDYQGTGYIDGGRKQITVWLYQSLLENKPYDRLVRELIDPKPESEGFINGIQWRGRVNASQTRQIQFSQNVSQVFFGINMKCASCHDSFIDHWKLDDAYSLAAVIAEEPLEIHRCDVATGRMAEPRFFWPELGSIDGSLSKADRLRQLSELVTHSDNGRFTRTIANRIWQRLMGRGIVHPVDMMGTRPWSSDLLDYLAVYLADHEYDLRKLIAHMVTSRAYQSACVARVEQVAADEYVFRGPELKRMTAEQFMDALWMITRTAPEKVTAPIQRPDPGESHPAEWRFVRAALVPADALQRSLGRPNREQVVTTRGVDLTTLQALDLSNGALLADTLARGATQLLAAHPERTVDRWIEDIYLQALCRHPVAQELEAAREVLGTEVSAESLADFLWIVLMLPEFQLIR